MGELQKFLISTQKSTAAVILQWTTDQTSLCSGYYDCFGSGRCSFQIFSWYSHSEILFFLQVNAGKYL